MELGAAVRTTGPDPLLAEIDGVIQRADRLSKKSTVGADDVALLRSEMKQTFVWRLDFAEVYRRRGGFDIAIANPPYVRQEALGSAKWRFRTVFPATFSGTTDLYVYFYDRSLSVLRKHGILCFISSNKFFRARYGAQLRALLAANTTIQMIVDFGDLPVFDATTYPCIVLVRNAAPDPEHVASTLTIDSMSLIPELGSLLKDAPAMVPQSSLANGGWVLEDRSIRQLLAKIVGMRKTLGQHTDNRMYYGIKTGLNSAFVINEATRSRLISQDARVGTVIRPFVRGREIKRWRIAATRQYLLYIPWSFPIADSPAIEGHLRQFKTHLEERPEVQAGRFPWYALSRFAAEYVSEFDKPKIMYPHNSTAPAYAFDSEGRYCNDKAYIIPTNERWLLALLNSVVSEFQLAQMSPSLRGGYYEHRIIYVSKLAIPELSPDVVGELWVFAEAGLEGMVDQDALDSYVCDLYGLSDSERQVIYEYLDRQKRRDLHALRGVLGTSTDETSDE